MANPELQCDSICRNSHPLPAAAAAADKWFRVPEPRVLASATSLNLSSKFPWTRQQREASPRHLQYRGNGANIQINDSGGCGGSVPNRSQPGDKSDTLPTCLNSLSSWWTFSWPASSEMCQHDVRVINRSAYMPEQAVPLQHSDQIRSTYRLRERVLEQTELWLLSKTIVGCFFFVS